MEVNLAFLSYITDAAAYYLASVSQLHAAALAGLIITWVFVRQLSRKLERIDQGLKELRERSVENRLELEIRIRGQLEKLEKLSQRLEEKGAGIVTLLELLERRSAEKRADKAAAGERLDVLSRKVDEKLEEIKKTLAPLLESAKQMDAVRRARSELKL
jgi:hypothetical protein